MARIKNINQNINQNWNDQMGGNYYGFGGIPSTEVGDQFANARMDMTSNPAYRGTFPGSAYSPHRGFEEMQFDETVQEPAQKTGILQSILGNTMLGKMLSAAKDSPTEAFNRKYFDTAELGGSQKVNLHPAYNLYGNKNVSSMFGDLGKGGEKRIARIEKTIANLPEQWSNLATGTEEEQALYAQKMASHREKLKQFKLQQAHYQNALNQELGKDSTSITKPVITSKGDQVVTGGGQTDTSGWDSPGYTTRGGFAPRETSASQHAGAGATTGKRGHHSWADGGRIGYQDGELVEQETDFMQGPHGGEEFQETVVEGQGQPSREQLEALAMKIFQLPLDELDEQQLLVVYQEAMQGQPMEEVVQEEDVQFAANGGRMGYLLGGDIEKQTDFIEGPQEDLMASTTSFDDGRNQLSLQLFGKELHLLTEEEMDMLNDEMQRLTGKFTGAEGGLASIL